MCVDDYQFRHYSAIKPKQCRRFIILNQDQIEKVYLVNISQFQENNQVALCKILLYLVNKGLIINDRIFYLPKYDVFLQPNTHCKVPFQALDDKDIIMRSVHKDKINTHTQSIKMEGQTQMDDQQMKPELNQQPHNFQLQGNQCKFCIGKIPSQQDLEIKNLLEEDVENYDDQIQQLEYIKTSQKHIKRVKQPQRKIGQVILAVKKWRKLYQAKKMKLNKSAKLLGYSKKSLDDYYLVLRVGQILGYNYGQNMERGMGDLRSYIRQTGCKTGGKLTKEVKCFDLVMDFDLDEVMNELLKNNIGNGDKQSGQDYEMKE